MRFLFSILVVWCAGLVLAQVDFGCREFLEAPSDSMRRDGEPMDGAGLPQTRWMTAALNDSNMLFNDKVRQAYFDYCLEQVAPELTSLSETTWKWLMNNPGVLNATFALTYPPDPNIIYNFVKFAQCLGQKDTERFEQLLIAYAISTRGKRLESNKLEYFSKNALEAGVRSEGGWYLNKKRAVPTASASEIMANPSILSKINEIKAINKKYDMADKAYYNMADWLTSNVTVKVYEVLPLKGNAFLNKTQLTVAPEVLSKSPWMNIAYNAHRFPPTQGLGGGNVYENLKLHIERYKEKKGPFPLDKAPWPLLMLVTQKDPTDESTYFWNMYRDTGSVPGYSTYTFSYDKPEVVYKDSKWHPNSHIRFLEDGGVCGRLSMLAEFGQRSIGVPACGMGQPGHRAFMTYQYDAGSGRYSVALHHSVDTLEVSTAGWFLPPPLGETFDEKTKCYGFGPVRDNNVRWHFGLCEAVNRGLASYENSRMVVHMLKIFNNMSQAQRETLLRSGLIMNIANTDIVFELAKIYSGDAKRIKNLISVFRNAVVRTESGLTETKKIKADQDLTKMLKDPNRNIKNTKKLTNEWGLFISHQLFMGAFGTIPDVNDEKFADLWAGEKVQVVRKYADAVDEELKYQIRISPDSKYVEQIKVLNEKYNKTRLLADQKNVDRKPPGRLESQKKAADVW